MINSLDFKPPSHFKSSSFIGFPGSNDLTKRLKDNCSKPVVDSHLPRLKLPSGYPEQDLIKKKTGFDKKIQYFVELGLRPNCRLSYENLMKLNNAKKKLITFSDFMRKSLQQKLLTSDILSDLCECKINEKSSPVKSKNCDRVNSSVKPRIQKANSFNLATVNESLGETGKGKAKREIHLKKLKEIEVACDDMIKRKSYTKKSIKIV